MPFSLFPNCVGIAPNNTKTNAVIWTFTFQIFYNSQASCWYFSIISFSFQNSYLQKQQNQWFYKSFSSYQLRPNLNFQVFYCMVKRLYNLHSLKLFVSCSCHLSVTSKLHYLTSSQWTMSIWLLCLLLYSLHASLLHPLTKWSVLSFVSIHNRHDESSWLLSMLDVNNFFLLIWFFKKKKKLYSPFLWMGFKCLKATATLRRQFTFYHSVPRNSSWLQLWQICSFSP